MSSRKHNQPIYYRFSRGTMPLLSSSGHWYEVDPDHHCNCPARGNCWHIGFRRELMRRTGETLEQAGWNAARIVCELRGDFPEIM